MLHTAIESSFTVDNCPSNITAAVEKDDVGVIVTWGEPKTEFTHNDKMSSAEYANYDIVTSQTHGPGDLFPIGRTPVTYTFATVDGSETHTCDFIVEVLRGRYL